MGKTRLVIGISGASGVPIAVEILRQLHHSEIETHLVYTRGAEMTLGQETNLTRKELNAMADVVYDNSNIGAAIASGTFRTAGMIVVPCSMKTVAGIVSGYSDNLLLRAADVTIKERRKLVLVARETPLSTIHLRNLYEISRMGAVVIPPVLSYYNHPDSVGACTAHIAGKVLDQFGIEPEHFCRWGEEGRLGREGRLGEEDRFGKEGRRGEEDRLDEKRRLGGEDVAL